MDAFSSRSAENTLSVRPDRQYDPHYRYRMPPLDCAVDNRNKQRKTRLHNSSAVARNIFRPEAWLVKYMALELSTDSSCSGAGAAYLTGHHEAAQLQELGKGAFNVDETRMEAYEQSKLAKILTLVRLLQQDVLRRAACRFHPCQLGLESLLPAPPNCGRRFAPPARAPRCPSTR